MYMQQIKNMIPNFDYTEGEEIQGSLLNLILGLKENCSIENLFIDLKFMQDFVPEN